MLTIRLSLSWINFHFPAVSSKPSSRPLSGGCHLTGQIIPPRTQKFELPTQISIFHLNVLHYLKYIYHFCRLYICVVRAMTKQVVSKYRIRRQAQNYADTETRCLVFPANADCKLL